MDMGELNKKVDWSGLIIGILLFIMAVIVFIYPVENFFAITWLIGLLAIINGVLEIIFRRARKFLLGISQGWTITLGILNIIFGILIMFNLGVGFLFLSYYFAAWFIVGAFINLFTVTPAGKASKGMRILTIILDILYLLAALVLLFNPLLAAATVSIIIGISLLFSSLFYIFDAFN